METRSTSRQTPPSRRRAEVLGTCLLLLVGAWFYSWTATSAGSPLGFELQNDDLYNRLTDGFLAGRLSFAEEPPPELARLANPYDPAQNAPFRKYHDVSYYQGRYYLYFGPTPALVLLAPWRLLTGASLPQNLAVAVFAWGSALLGVLLLRELRDRFFPAASGGLVLSGAVAVCFGSLLPVLLRRPLYYELAIASACFFGLVALWCLLRVARGDDWSRRWLAAVGLALGLAVVSRPNHLFGSAALFVVVCAAWWHGGVRGRDLVRRTLPLVLPYAVCVAGLLSYNYARFGSIAEFGASYMLAGGNQSGVSQTGLRYVPINLYYYLAALPGVGAYFPFVQVTGFPCFAPPAGYSGQENMYGLAVTLPVLWALVWVWTGVKRGAPDRLWRLWARAAAGLAAGNFGFLLLMMGAANRYLLDFTPVLVVLAVLGLLHADSGLTGWRRGWLRAGWSAALAVTMVFNVLVSLQHNGLLRHHNPATYARLARAVNGWAEALTGAARRSGPLRIELTLPKNRAGRLEPLVVTGWSFQADFLYVFYKDERHIQIGFEHTSYGGPLSPPLAVDYDRPHVIEVEMGSLYPPREHPYFDGKSDDEIARLKRTLSVKLDGRVVHEGLYDFYDASPGDVSVGRNHVSEAFGRKFTGVVRGVTRPPATQ